MRGTRGLPVWQSNYYEHIVRTDAEPERIRDDMRQNPANGLKIAKIPRPTLSVAVINQDDLPPTFVIRRGGSRAALFFECAMFRDIQAEARIGREVLSDLVARDAEHRHPA